MVDWLIGCHPSFHLRSWSWVFSPSRCEKETRATGRSPQAASHGMKNAMSQCMRIVIHRSIYRNIYIYIYLYISIYIYRIYTNHYTSHICNIYIYTQMRNFQRHRTNRMNSPLVVFLPRGWFLVVLFTQFLQFVALCRRAEAAPWVVAPVASRGVASGTGRVKKDFYGIATTNFRMIFSGLGWIGNFRSIFHLNMEVLYQILSRDWGFIPWNLARNLALNRPYGR